MGTAITIWRGSPRTLWAIGDQGVVSLGNFLVNVTLARWLPPHDYGVYALLFVVMVALNTVHGSLISYPLSVRGAKAAQSEMPHLLGTSLSLSCLLAVPLGCLIAATAVAIGCSRLSLWVTASMVAWQLQETCRRALISQLRPRAAIGGDLISYLGQAVAIYYLLNAGVRSLHLIFAAMIATSCVAALVQALQVGLASPKGPLLSKYAFDYWLVGRFVLGGSLLTILGAQAFPFVLGYFHGAARVANFQAIAAVVAASHPVVLSVGTLIIMPATAKASLAGIGAARRVMFTHGLQGGLLLLPYFFILLIWPKSVLACIYGRQSPYLSLENLLRVYVLAYVMYYLSTVVTAYLAGLEYARAWLMVETVAATTAVCVGYPLTARLGTSGAVAGVAVVCAVRLAMAAAISHTVYTTRLAHAQQS